MQVARDEAEAKVRSRMKALEDDIRKAREEAQVREQGERKAREEAEAKAVAEREAHEEEIRKTRAEAELRSAAERKAREEAETIAAARMKAHAEEIRKAREEAELRSAAERKAREEAETTAAARVKAHEEEIRKTREEAELRSATERKAREEAETTAAARMKSHAEEIRKTREEAVTVAAARMKSQEEEIRKTREEAEAKVDRERRARTEAEAQIEIERESRNEAISRAREEAERKARAEVEATIGVERLARAEAEVRAAAEREAREIAERKAQAELEAQIGVERKAREEAEQKAQAALQISATAEKIIREAAAKQTGEAEMARGQAQKMLDTARLAHEQAVAKAQAEMMARVKAEQKAITEKRARAAAEDRAKQEAVARVMQEHQSRSRAEKEIKSKVEIELRAREQAEREADVKARTEAQERANAVAARRTLEQREGAALATTKKPGNWGRMAAISLALIIVLAAGLSHLVPLSSYIGDVEKLLSERLQEPVRISELHFSLFPSPQLKLDRVSIGKLQDAKIAVAIIPLLSLDVLKERKEFDEIQLMTVTIDQDVIPRMAAWLQPQPGDSRLRLNRLRLSGVKLTLRDVELPSFDAVVNLARDGSLQKALLREPKMTVELTPINGGLQANISAQNWQPPLGPGLVFTELAATAAITRQQVVVTSIDSSFYGGSLKGAATIKWSSGLRADGQFSLKGVNLPQLLPVFTGAFALSGTLDTDAKFTTQGQKPDELFATPRINAAFTLHKGVINNVDLVRAIQSAGRGTQRGGKTQFNEIMGEAQTSDNRIAYRNLKLSSGPMSANGAIDVAPAGELSGRINAVLGTSAATVARGTLTVSGSLKDPLIGP